MTLTTEQLKHILDNPNEFSLSQVQEMAAELLANREAQPDDKPFGYYSKETAAILERRGFAPISANPLVDHNIPLYTAPPAPAVPQEISSAIRHLKDALVACNRFNYCADAVNRVEDACRAAMLAQPVSSGYTFNSPVIPDGWKLVPVEPTTEMINAALASGALSIRTAYRVMLAAAPEGGNDHDTRR